MNETIVKRYEAKNNIENMGDWLRHKYIDEQLTMGEIMKLLNTNANRTITSFLNYYDIPVRHGSEAIKTQYIGKKGIKRKEISRNIANTCLKTKESRDILRKAMKSDEYINKCRIAKLGELNGMYGISGEDNVLWNPNKTRLERQKDRKLLENARWRKEIFERDNYTCQLTGDRKGHYLVAHHLNSYNSNTEDRFNIDNGITILESIHKLFHKQYGYGNNTKAQFEEFKSLLSIKGAN